MTEILCCWRSPCKGAAMPAYQMPYHMAAVHPRECVDDHDLVEVTINTRRPEGYVLVDLNGPAWMISEGKWIRANDDVVAQALAVLHMATRRPPGTPG